MRRRSNSLWQLMVNDHRRSSNRTARKKPTVQTGKSFMSSVCDTVCFNPQGDSTNMWRNMYKMNRQVKLLERNLYQQAAIDDGWLGQLISGAISTWHEFVDECKALLTALGFHLLTLVLIVVFNLIWFGGLFWLIGVWLGG